MAWREEPYSIKWSLTGEGRVSAGLSCDSYSHAERPRTWTAARLDDEDILSAHALFNLDPRLAHLELAKEDLCGRDAEVVADGPAPRQYE
jgi:hypothetical protein